MATTPDPKKTSAAMSAAEKAANRDDAMDKKAGIKEDSKRDKALDKARGVK